MKIHWKCNCEWGAIKWNTNKRGRGKWVSCVVSGPFLAQLMFTSNCTRTRERERDIIQMNVQWANFIWIASSLICLFSRSKSQGIYSLAGAVTRPFCLCLLRDLHRLTALTVGCFCCLVWQTNLSPKFTIKLSPLQLRNVSLTSVVTVDIIFTFSSRGTFWQLASLHLQHTRPICNSPNKVRRVVSCVLPSA